MENYDTDPNPNNLQVGDRVRIFGSPRVDWNRQIGVITHIPSDDIRYFDVDISGQSCFVLANEITKEE